MVLDKKFWKLVNLDKSDIGSIYFYAILNGLLQLSVPLGIQAIIGFVMGTKMVVSIYVLIALVSAGVCIVGILQINQMKIIESINQKIFTRYAFAFVDIIPKFDLYQTDQHYLPEQINRFFDTMNIQKGFAKLLLEIPTALTQIFFGFILLSFYNPIFLPFGLIIVIIILITLYISSKKGSSTSLLESTAKYKVVSWLQEIAKSVIAFKFTQNNQLDVTNTDNYVVSYLKYRTDHFKILLFQYKTMVAFKVLITASLLSVGVYLLVSQKLNIGEFIAAEIVILTIIASVENIIKNLDSVYDVQTALEKLETVTERPSETSGTIEMKATEIGIQLTHFTFSHPESPILFDNAGFYIPPNSLVCILGDENSGKTTLLKILSGCYTQFSGNILFNNIPLNNYELISLRNKIQLYLNTAEILSGTILENISMGNNDYSEVDILRKADQLGFSKFLQDFPAGFQTKTESEGKQFSNADKQKILLLRALVPNSNLITMEEPWKELEIKYKSPIIQFLQEEKKYKTIIVASNDEEFAKNCDFRIEITNGNLKLT